jgi:hypothetical protein
MQDRKFVVRVAEPESDGKTWKRCAANILPRRRRAFIEATPNEDKAWKQAYD